MVMARKMETQKLEEMTLAREKMYIQLASGFGKSAPGAVKENKDNPVKQKAQSKCS